MFIDFVVCTLCVFEGLKQAYQVMHVIGVKLM